MDGGIGRAVLGGRTVLVLTITKPSPRVQAVSVDLDVGYYKRVDSDTTQNIQLHLMGC